MTTSWFGIMKLFPETPCSVTPHWWLRIAEVGIVTQRELADAINQGDYFGGFEHWLLNIHQGITGSSPQEAHSLAGKADSVSRHEAGWWVLGHPQAVNCHQCEFGSWPDGHNHATDLVCDISEPTSPGSWEKVTKVPGM